MPNALLDAVVKRRDEAQNELDALLAKVSEEKRHALSEDEDVTFAALNSEIAKLDERAEELVAVEKRKAAAAEVRKLTGEAGEQRKVGGAQVTDPTVYARGNRNASYFRDMAKAKLMGDGDAFDRLRRHAAQQADEQRALGNTNTTGGSGGEFAPPSWLVADYIALARPGRVTVDLFTKSDVPAGVSSVNLPRIVTGTSVAIQSTQNTALSQTDLTTAYVSTGFTTIGGKQVVSQQLLDQSEIDFDQVIKSDLAAAYAQTVGTQVWTGAGTGANNNSVINGLVNATVPSGNQIAYTGTAAAATFYSKANGAISAFVTSRYTVPTHWVMHPRRWFWLMAQADGNGRPLVVPTDGGVQAFNAMGADRPGVYDRGVAGTFLGLPVIIDPLIPTNFGTGTNQDRVYLIKADDLWWFESPTRAEVFPEPYADTVGVLFRLYSYAGAILNRQPNSIAYIDGTALVPPTF